MDNEKKLLELRQKAKQLSSEKNWEELLSVSSEIIKLTPKDDEAYVNRGSANAKLNNFQDAINDYDIALEINPNNDSAYVARSFAKSKLGDFQGEIDDCNKALEINPNNDDAYVNRSFAKEKLGDFQGEIDDCNKALKINPESDHAYVNRGVAKSKLGDSQGSINDCNKALEINSNNERAYVNRGIAKKNIGYYKDAINDFNEALKRNPSNIKAIRNKSVAQALDESQTQKDKTIADIKEGYEKQFAESQEQFEKTQKELIQADHYETEKVNYKKKFDAYSDKKSKEIDRLILIVSIVSVTLFIYLLYLLYLVLYKDGKWEIFSFFPALTIASLFLFPFIWRIRNTEYDRSRYWAISEDMHTKWMFLLSMSSSDISKEMREKILLQFLEHLNNSNTPNIILSKDVGDKNDLNSMAKNLILQKGSEQPPN